MTQTNSVQAGHPKTLYILFFSELWERFSFYGMRALLVLYMTKELLYGDKDAYGVYGAYGALVYAFPVVGGILADKILGYRKAVILGGTLMSLGHFAMAIPSTTAFYLALALLCLGNGFFKPNISSMVGKLYPDGDPRRDGGFTIFYMGINIGAFLAPLVCGLIGEKFGWHYGFGLAGVGMVAGLVVFLKGQKLLGEVGLPPEPAKLTAKSAIGLSNYHSIIMGSLLVIPLVAWAIANNDYLGSLLYVVGVVVLAYLLYIAFSSDTIARGKMLVAITLLFFNMVFWAFFEQAGSSLVLFADRNVDRLFGGWEFPASMTQTFNPFFIIVLAPFFSMMWSKLASIGKQPSIPMKFALAIVQVGLGFGALVIGAKFAADSGMTGMIWLVLAYLLHTTGELCISPVGLSAMTKLAPARAVGTMMGAWFLSTSFSHHAAGVIAKLAGIQGDTGAGEKAATATETLSIYTGVFWEIFVVSAAIGVLLMILTPLLKRGTHGVV